MTQGWIPGKERGDETVECWLRIATGEGINPVDVDKFCCGITVENEHVDRTEFMVGVRWPENLAPFRDDSVPDDQKLIEDKWFTAAILNNGHEYIVWRTNNIDVVVGARFDSPDVIREHGWDESVVRTGIVTIEMAEPHAEPKRKFDVLAIIFLILLVACEVSAVLKWSSSQMVANIFNVVGGPIVIALLFSAAGLTFKRTTEVFRRK